VGSVRPRVRFQTLPDSAANGVRKPDPETRPPGGKKGGRLLDGFFRSGTERTTFGGTRLAGNRSMRFGRLRDFRGDGGWWGMGFAGRG
jgi:hypothetical protein